MYKKIFLWMGLVLYSVILFLFMTFFRLPTDEMIGATIDGLTNGRVLIDSKRISPSFLLNYKMEDVSIGIIHDDKLIQDSFKSIIFRPDYPGLFRGYLPLKIDGLISKGYIHVNMGISFRKGTEDAYLNIEFSDLFLEDLKILRSFFKRDLAGKLKGMLKIDGDLTAPSSIDGEGFFHVENGAVKTKMNLPMMERVPFESIRLTMTIKDGIITFKNSEMKGPMFSGTLSGKMKLGDKIDTSRLDLTARMKPGPIIERNALAAQFLRRIRKGNDPINIRIAGTLYNPSISWRKN